MTDINLRGFACYLLATTFAVVFTTIILMVLKYFLTCDIFKAVRDQYRLGRICMLSPSNNVRCGFCHNYFNGSEILLDTTCCGKNMQMVRYYEKARTCPYCTEAFYPTTCCVCKMYVREMHTAPQKKSRGP